MPQKQRKQVSNTYHDSPAIWKPLLLRGVQEDGWPWDWTSRGIRMRSKGVRAKVLAKSEGVWAAEGLVSSLASVAEEMDGGPFQASSSIRTREEFSSGKVVCQWTGSHELILALERPFLNLAAYACAIATTTRRIVEVVGRACPKNTPRVTATRKTLPYYRDLALHAVQAGGGFSHRVNLAGGVLVKENHIAAAGGVSAAIDAARRVAPHGLKIEVEVRNRRELTEALAAGAEGVLLDNFTPEEVRAALKVTQASDRKIFVEVSGGLNEKTAAQYALPGVDILSFGSLTHSVKAVDLSLLVD